MPVISPTTLFVTGSIRWMLSPAEFVWMIRTVDDLAAIRSSHPRRTATPAIINQGIHVCHRSVIRSFSMARSNPAYLYQRSQGPTPARSRCGARRLAVLARAAGATHQTYRALYQTTAT